MHVELLFGDGSREMQQPDEKSSSLKYECPQVPTHSTWHPWGLGLLALGAVLGAQPSASARMSSCHPRCAPVPGDTVVVHLSHSVPCSFCSGCHSPFFVCKTQQGAAALRIALFVPPLGCPHHTGLCFNHSPGGSVVLKSFHVILSLQQGHTMKYNNLLLLLEQFPGELFFYLFFLL